MASVEWGEYRVGDLFDIVNTLSFNKERLTAGDEYDYVTRTSLNQGILQCTGFVNESNLNEANVWSLGLLQMDFFYRKRKWYAGQFVRKIIPKFDTTVNSAKFFSVMLNKLKPILLQVLVRNVDETFRSQSLYLPTKNNQIDFEFMESFIAELSAYLKVSGLDNYKLSIEELNALQAYNTMQWREYRIGSLFSRVSTKKLHYKAKDLPTEAIDGYDLPCLTSSFRNQGLNYFVPREGATILKDVISIPSNSDVYRAYFQSREFTVLSDAYAIKWTDEEQKLSNYQYLFMVRAINKVTDLPIYSYKMKLGGWNVVKDKTILLPVVDDEIDFDFMNDYTRAISKLAIKDVVKYTDKRIEATKEVVESHNR
ncbi:restriction endonuclease subunit S [Streptococcus anginosus]|uniref:restriction endonuclease subunit S n=1 Tax=Streptococcus anginosus TaxID=1328 RepID=UPI001E39CACA|nr:restriction endonuclease subunit S [Streptococcus anginosus]MDB8661195.1 restriction endonuclease subunit S [Streptococcus anginosus]